MKIKLFTTTFLTLFLFISTINAQNNFELILRANLGIGAEYESLKFENENASGDLLFSPGGGIGAEIGLGYLLNKKFVTYATLGYQQNFAIQYHSSTNGGTDKTSFSFSRSSMFVGVNYIFKFKEDSNFGMQIGGGGNYNLPGKMSITELNFKYGDVAFNSSLGFHVETGLTYSFKKWIVVGSLRYRQLSFKLKDYTQPTNNSITNENFSQFPEYIKNINASGVDLSVSFIKKL